MDYSQVRAFNQGLGGHTPNMCLDNVRRGFGIANKYASAWEAWLHTEQHPDRNIPVGLDVPLYYSYTATIDGITENYGHINVRLADGRVWSDGNIYANIDAYLANHTPKFVGWGESVNDFEIIKGVSIMSASQDIVDETAVRQAYNAGLLRDPTQAEIDARVGAKNTLQQMQSSILASDEHKQILAKVQNNIPTVIVNGTPYVPQK